MDNCIFCNIASGDIPTEFLYEDEQVVAFSDIDPKAPHHILIIPRKHIATLNDTSEKENALIGHIINVATKLAKQLGIDEAGYRVLFNCNKGGGQAVFHIHLHLLGGRVMHWPPG